MNIEELISGVKAGDCACENKDGPKLEVHCTHHPRDALVLPKTNFKIRFSSYTGSRGYDPIDKIY